MRMARIKLVGETAVYHCISRVVGGQKLLDSLCKEKLVELLGRLSAFCGVEVWDQPRARVPGEGSQGLPVLRVRRGTGR